MQLWQGVFGVFVYTEEYHCYGQDENAKCLFRDALVGHRMYDSPGYSIHTSFVQRLS